MKLKIITAALSACLLVNVAPGFADVSAPANPLLFTLFQRECGPDDLHIAKDKSAQTTLCTWKKTSDNDSGMQVTLHFDDQVVQSAKADCTFTPAKDSSDQIRDVEGYKSANGMLEDVNIKPINTALGGKIRLHHQQITFNVLNPGVSDNANIVFLMTKWWTKRFFDFTSTTYTTGSTVSCTFTPVVYADANAKAGDVSNTPPAKEIKNKKKPKS